MLVPQRAGVIAKQPGSSGAAGQADVLLDGLLAHSHAVTLSQSGLVHPLSPSSLVATLLR